MEENLISFETAKLAKEKGFNIPVLYYFNHENIITADGLNYCNYNLPYFCTYSAPTQSLLQHWLREKHNIHIEIRFIDDIIKFNYIVVTMNNNTEVYSEINESYEEALNFGLLKALEII